MFQTGLQAGNSNHWVKTATDNSKQKYQNHLEDRNKNFIETRRPLTTETFSVLQKSKKKNFDEGDVLSRKAEKISGSSTGSNPRPTDWQLGHRD